MKQSTHIHYHALALAAMFATATVSAQPLGGDNCDVPETMSSAQAPAPVVAAAVEGDNCDAPMRYLSPYLAAMALTKQPAETLGGDNCDAPELYLPRKGLTTAGHLTAGSTAAD